MGSGFAEAVGAAMVRAIAVAIGVAVAGGVGVGFIAARLLS